MLTARTETDGGQTFTETHVRYNEKEQESEYGGKKQCLISGPI